MGFKFTTDQLQVSCATHSATPRNLLLKISQMLVMKLDRVTLNHASI